MAGTLVNISKQTEHPIVPSLTLSGQQIYFGEETQDSISQAAICYLLRLYSNAFLTLLLFQFSDIGFRFQPEPTSVF